MFLGNGSSGCVSGQLILLAGRSNEAHNEGRAWFLASRLRGQGTRLHIASMVSRVSRCLAIHSQILFLKFSGGEIGFEHR